MAILTDPPYFPASSTTRYLAFPSLRCCSASFTLDIGYSSVTGLIPCLAANFSIARRFAGLPVGLPETCFSPTISENALTGIGSSTAPTTCSRPRGASAFTYASQSSDTFTVTTIKSSVPAIALISVEFLEFTTRCAPIFISSSVFPAVDENAVTSQPHARVNISAMCPSPPIPTTPTRDVGVTPKFSSGEKTVIPPHNSGPADAASNPSGNGIAHVQCARMCEPNPP